MVWEWVPPVERLLDDDRTKVIAFLERQGRFDLAVWVGYRRRRGHAADHELMLRLRGRRPGRQELQVLFWGVSYELPTHCYVGFPTRAEMREVRRVGELIWERPGPPREAADPLDYSLSSERVELLPSLRDQIRAAMEVYPVVRRVQIRRSKLWKSGQLLRQNVTATVECDGSTAGLGKGPVGALADVLRGHFREFGATLVEKPTPVRGPSTVAYTRKKPGG